MEVPEDYENLHKKEYPLVTAVSALPSFAAQRPPDSPRSRTRRGSVDQVVQDEGGALEEPRPAVETRRGHDLRSKESNTKRGRRGRSRLGQCGGAARRWNTPARPRSRSGGARLQTPLKAQCTEELDARQNARMYWPKYA